MAQAHAAMAGLMLAAGLTPRLQFGEILWWFLADAAGMAFHDADTQAAALAALGRPLASFHTPNDDPAANGYADANFLRARLYNYVAAIQSFVLSQCPSSVFELLWPMDVNDPDNCRLLRYINLPTQWTTRAGSIGIHSRRPTRSMDHAYESGCLDRRSLDRRQHGESPNL